LIPGVLSKTSGGRVIRPQRPSDYIHQQTNGSAKALPSRAEQKNTMVEIIMRTLSSPTIRLQSVATRPSSLIASLQAWWVTFLNWRIQRAAILQLEAMSDRDLHDIGLRRCEIENAVKSEPARAFIRRN
jgi:uncharacterized protein YjiS (DUF1127 family)